MVVFASGETSLGLPAAGLYVTTGVDSPPDPASAVVRFNPPQPTPATSSFGVANNWQPLNGDPARVPQKNTILNDTALFDRVETYTVELGDQHANRMIVQNGNVTFTGGKITVDALDFNQPSLLIENAHVTLEVASVLQLESIINANHALIGDSGAARLDVQASAQLNCAGSLRIGGRAEGILTIDHASVTNGETRIGGSGHGHADAGAGAQWSTGNLAIGIGGGEGDLTIHDGAAVKSEFVVIGEERTFGNSATIKGVDSTWTSQVLAVGGRGSGDLEVSDGALISTEIFRVGNEPGVIGSAIVKGSDVNGTDTEVDTGTLIVGSRSMGELVIQEGAIVKVSGDNVVLGSSRAADRGRANVIVDGIGPATGRPSLLLLTNANVALAIGDNSSATLAIRSGGIVDVNPQGLTYVACGIPSDPTEVRVEGTASILKTGLLSVGATGNENAYVTLVGGTVQASDAIVGSHGIIRGTGTLAVAPSHRLINAGQISPGLSPGILTILGNYEQAFNGSLLIEFGGTNSTAHDQLIVTNTATLDGKITLRFINGFAPKNGDRINFLSAPTINGSFATVAVQNLAPGFQFDLASDGASMGLTALNDAVFDPTLPGDLGITITNVGGITYAIAIATTPDSCDSIELDGRFKRSGNSFVQAFQGARLINAECASIVTTGTNTLVLGALSPGDYTFTATSAGQVIASVPFTVPGQTPTLLKSERLADGSVQFEVNAPPSVRSVIEASLDLFDWSALEGNALPGPFIDFDAMLFPQRFYRARFAP